MAIRTPALLFVFVLGYATAARIQQSTSSKRGSEKVAASQPSTGNRVQSSQKEADTKEHSLPASPVTASLVQDTVAAKALTTSSLATSLATRHVLFVAIGLGIAVVFFCIWKIACMFLAKEGEDTTGKMRNKETLKKLRGDTCSDATISTAIGRQEVFHGDRMVYEWAQNNEVTKVYIKAPEGVSADEFEIEITPRRLTIGRKGKPFFINEATYDVIDVDESAWRLCTNGEIQIHMSKVTPGEWPCALLAQTEEANSF